jgi:hypothetical protein
VSGDQIPLVTNRSNSGAAIADTLVATQSATAPVITLTNQGTAPGTPSGGDVLYATSAGVLTYKNPQGLVSTLVGSQGGLTATTTVATTTAATALQSLAIPAADAIAGAVYRLVGWGVYSDTGTPTLAFTSTFGATGIAAVPAVTLGSGVSNVPFRYEATLDFYTTTTAMGSIQLSLGTSASTNAASLFVSTPTAAVTVGVTAQAFAVNVTWSASSASNTISLLGGYSERVA